jgi:TonB-linked SusC/RagA family outer membrane protein
MIKRVFLIALWILALCAPGILSAQAQATVVKGKVTSANGGPIEGASVVNKTTTKGTATNAAGEFSINASTGDELTITATGHSPFEIKLKDETIIDASLKPLDGSLGEVVVVGYGTQRRRETTGAIASIKASELTQTPIANVAQGLQARVSGVQINQNSGAPGGNVSVRIRGTNSITGTSEPLYVVDGIQISNGGGITDVSPLSTINPNDIESVEVLKDASASAIYGARAANGVVLITTKRGKSGATRVTFDSYFGVQKVSKTLPVLNAADFAALDNEVYKNNFYPDPKSLGEGVNWQDLIFQEAPMMNHQLSITGGNEKTQLALSLNYFDQDGIIIKSNFKRYSVRLNLDHRISSKIKIGTSILGST